MSNTKKQSRYGAVGAWMRRAGGWALLKSAGPWCLLVALGSLPASAQQIKTVAGGGPNSEQATAAKLGPPTAIAQDHLGNFYIAVPRHHRVYKVDAAGTLTIFAGKGAPHFSGDGGPAASAELSEPFGVFVDGAGNIFIADTNNHRIRKVDTAGNIQTVAGNGTAGFSGDGGPATGASLKFPSGAFVDSAGNIFIADTFNHRIRKVNTAENIQTVAGNGTADFGGDGIGATSALLNTPRGVFVDGAGNIFIADTSNHRIRKVDTTGTILTVAGNGTR
jgi:sugar lactone lactonase YvrE